MHVPLRVQIISISSSFWENLAKWYVGAPGGLFLPSQGNSGSATDYVQKNFQFSPIKKLWHQTKQWRIQDLPDESINQTAWPEVSR